MAVALTLSPSPEGLSQVYPHTSWYKLIMDAGRESIEDKVSSCMGQSNLHCG